MSPFEISLEAALIEREQMQRYRQRMTLTSPQSTRVRVGDKDLLSFASNDYLGLANHPDIITAFQQAAETRGVGSGASHLVCGHSDYHHQLEEALAKFTGRDRALLFSTGYMANLGVISAFVNRKDTIWEDKWNHASLLDAAHLSRAKLKRFRHNDCSMLERELLKDGSNSNRRFIVVDGVFSMDGDLAPLTKLSTLAEQHDAILMVDDAHGFGVLGEHGGGCAQLCKLNQQQLPLLVGTLGKAFGTFGAFVAGSNTVIESLIQLARPYIYTTALPPAVAAASLKSLSLLQSESWRREQLHARIAQFRDGAEAMGLHLMDSTTPIQPLLVGHDADVLAIAKQLNDKGFMVGAIRPPTVPEGTARLRITFSAGHSEEDVARLLLALDQVIPSDLRRHL